VLTIPNQVNLAERLRGYEDAFESFPGIKIVETVDIHGDPGIAFDKTQEIIDKRKDKVDAFISLEALSGCEVADVLDRKKVDGKLVMAMDTTGSTLDWIEKGKIAATVGQKPYTMAYYGLRMLADVKLYKPSSKAVLPAFVDTGSTLVDKANLAEFRQTAAPASK